MLFMHAYISTHAYTVVQLYMYSFEVSIGEQKEGVLCD